MEALKKSITRKKSAPAPAVLDTTPTTIYRKHGDGINGSMTLYTAPAAMLPHLSGAQHRHPDGSPVVQGVVFVEGVAHVEAWLAAAMIKDGLAYATAAKAMKV